MDSYNEESEADLKNDAKDVRNVCSTGKNQVKVQCDRKKIKSAANSKVFRRVCSGVVRLLSARGHNAIMASPPPPLKKRGARIQDFGARVG